MFKENYPQVVEEALDRMSTEWVAHVKDTPLADDINEIRNFIAYWIAVVSYEKGFQDGRQKLQ